VRPDTEVAKYRAKRADFSIDLAPGEPLSLAFPLEVRNIISREVGNQPAPELALELRNVLPVVTFPER
jgi:hypothetical protein